MREITKNIIRGTDYSFDRAVWIRDYVAPRNKKQMGLSHLAPNKRHEEINCQSLGGERK